FRGEKENDGSFFEALVSFAYNPIQGPSWQFKPQDASSTFLPTALNGTCDPYEDQNRNKNINYSHYKCTINFASTISGQFRFFKVKSYKGDADLSFILASGQLGLPNTVIHSVGQMGANAKDRK